MLVFVNSVCGCAAGNARPALRLALQHAVKPQQVVTVFAGQDLEATSRARQYFADYQPSSPSMALLRDGEVVHFVHRHQIEGRSPQLDRGRSDQGVRQVLRRRGVSHRLSGQPLHHRPARAARDHRGARHPGRRPTSGGSIAGRAGGAPARRRRVRSGERYAGGLLRRSVQFGIRVDRPELTVATAEVAQVTPLGQLEP